MKVTLDFRILGYFEIILFVCISIGRPCLTLNSPDNSGGYHIVLAVDDSISEPHSTSDFINNVKNVFELFSTKLWEASKQRFYIKSVDILAPNSWSVENASTAGDQSYNYADIRIPSSATRPYVENSNLCGVPGQFIELPFSVFNSSDEAQNPFGPSWKVLLNLWATYRWGVHEEHGYIGDNKFPYIIRDMSRKEWEVTSCSDADIKGSFRYLNDSTQKCSIEDTLNPGSLCRFTPEDNQTATTSLMHMHWLNSVVGFCDKDTHNKLSPNRQNSLCDHKSVWEVIRETKDYKTVVNPINDTLPNVTFNIVQNSPKPILYILLDQGLIQGPISLAVQIPVSLISFLGSANRYLTVASVGTFPTNSSGRETEEVVHTAVEWSQIGGDNLNKFADAVGYLNVGGPINRDFSRAISAAAEKIKRKAHPHGAIMLTVKYGADLDSLENYISEPELINILQDSGIIFNSIELKMTNHSGHAHFSELAQQTGGLYTVLSNPGEIQTSLGHVFNFLHKILDEEYFDLRKTYRTLLSTSVSAEKFVRFNIPHVSTPITAHEKVEIYFSTVDPSLERRDFVLEGVKKADGETVVLDGVGFKKRRDWNEEEGSKLNYLFQISNEKIAPYFEITFRTNCTSCRGSILVRTDIKDDTSWENVTLTVFTNKEGSQVDMRTEDPVVIYAKVLKNGAPVENAQVTATISELNAFTTTEVHLMDTGNQNPDEQSEDGIYSGYFIPETDGTFKITVVVKGNTILRKGKGQKGGKESRLLPVDQSDMGCSSGARCDMERLPEQFMEATVVATDMTILGAVQYIPQPSKVTSLLTVTVINEPDKMQIMWVAPSVPGRFSSVSSYDIRQSQDYGSLITDFENQESVTLPPGMIPAAPGSLESITTTKPSSTTFYAIRSNFRGKYSKVSDIHGVEVTVEDPPTTTTMPSESTASSERTTTTTMPSDSTASSESTPTEEPTTSSDSLPTSPNPTDSSTTHDSSTPDVDPTPTSASTPGSSSSPTDSSTSSMVPETTPKDDEKPWAQKPVGIAVITVIVVAVVIILLILSYLLWTRWKKSKTAKINPPPQSPKTSIPDSSTV